MKILHLDSSISGENSASRALSAAFVQKLTAADPAAELIYHDLVERPLEHLTFPEFQTAQSQAVLDEFNAADTIVIGAAMYNFTIPTQLKAWIDRVLIGGQTFRYTESGAEGLAGSKRVIVALARGGLYGEGSAQQAFEHAEQYLRAAFAFIGISQPEFVIAEGLALGDDARAASLQAALASVVEGRAAASARLSLEAV